MILEIIQGPAGLGFLAGATIFLGLPIARLSRVSPKVKAFLNAVSTGILIFLLVEITGHLIEEIEELVESAVISGSGIASTIRYGGLFVLGFSTGLLALVGFERRFLGTAKDEVPPAKRAKQLALMIAIGLGLHNLSEGLAIGQGYASGALKLAWLLAIGFALHNATEGFGIAAPLSGHRSSWRFLGLTGLIAGGPTFLGAMVGGSWTSKPVEIFCLALAAGTILYIVGELLHLGRHLKGEAIVEVGLLIGFFVAMGSDFAISSAMEVTAAHGPRHGGLFGDANDIYHYELVPEKYPRVRLYVSDHHNRPQDARSLQARWVLNPDSPKPVTGLFRPDTDGSSLTALLPSAAVSPVHIKIGVMKGGKWAEMEFYLAFSEDLDRLEVSDAKN